MYRGAADLLYFCTILHFRYININIYTINLFIDLFMWLIEMKKKKQRSSLCVIFQSDSWPFALFRHPVFCFSAADHSDVSSSDRSRLLSHVCVRPSCCLHWLCFLHGPLCFSMPKFRFVHKPNMARYCCLWHLHWDEHPVLNGLNIWQYPSLCVLCL